MTWMFLRKVTLRAQLCQRDMHGSTESVAVLTLNIKLFTHIASHSQLSIAHGPDELTTP